MSTSLDFLKPKSVAIIGASRDPSKRGHRAMQTLIKYGYTGKIVGVNPKESEVLGFPCYPDIASIPFAPDLAMVCTPNPTVPDMVRRCGEKGIKGALILAGGFSEAGPEGEKLEKELVKVAQESGVRIIGPNTNGMFNAHSGFNITGWPGIHAGKIGILSQSANVALSLLAQSHSNRSAGLTSFIGVGNQADIMFDEYLRFFGDDPETGALIMYVEGLKRGRAFVDTAREIAGRKPIVLYKAGRTEQGKSAAKSHSGSLAGDYPVAKGLFEQAGIIQVERSDEMFAVADTLSRSKGLPSSRVVLLSEGGGPISQAADALTDRGLLLPRLKPETEAALKKITPNATQLSNPVDAGGGTDPHPRYMPACSREILADPNVDALLIVGYFGGYQVRYGESLAESENQAARELVEIARASGKLVMIQCHYADFETEALDILRAGDIIVVRSIEIAASCLEAEQRFHRVQARARQAQVQAAAKPGAKAAVDRIVAAVRAEGRHSLLEPEALSVLQAYGISVPPFALMKEAGDAASLQKLAGGGTVALKIVSQDILHKSDVGGVRLNVAADPAVIARESQALIDHVKKTCPAAKIQGVLALPMAKKGTEVIIGAVNDEQFGRVLMFGLGGVFVEVLKDVVFRALPLSHPEALDMIASVKTRAVLDGVRGSAAADREGLAKLLVNLSLLAEHHPEIAEIDLNPVILNEDGITIVDARMILSKE